MTSAWPTILNELVKVNSAPSAMRIRKMIPAVIRAPSGSAMIVWVGMTCGNDNERGAAPRWGSRELQARGGVFARTISLLRMCLILAIVGVVSTSMTPRRSVYGDQGQEVAWEVSWEQFIAQQHEEESGPQQ